LVAKLAAVAMAASAASSVVGFMGSMGASRSARAIGGANAQLISRDAQVAENHKIAINQKLQLDLDRADKEFEELQGSTLVAFIHRGVDFTEGTPLDVLVNNVAEFEHDKNIAEYNTKIALQEQDEIAAFSRMRADVARLQGSAQAGQFRSQALGSLLGGSAKVADLGVKYGVLG
tara:strand:+ start:1384 stop:1908 length:525 start_codon:yes stop_codon:yes gene_type:complete